MSERGLRKAIEEYLGAPTAEGCLCAERDIEQVLAAEPDVVKVLRWIEEHSPDVFWTGTGPGAEDSIIGRWICETLHVRLTETGWEWTGGEDATDGS